LAPATRHVHVPSGRALVSSISIGGNFGGQSLSANGSVVMTVNSASTQATFNSRAFGANGRGVSAYLSPFYSWARVRQDQQTITHGLFRVSVGVDAAVSQSVGVTIGYETGANAGEGQPGATGGIFGLGVSYALNHGRQAAKARTPRPNARPNSTSRPDSTSKPDST